MKIVLSLPPLLLAFAILVAGCSPAGQFSPPNSGGANPRPLLDATASPEPTDLPANSTTLPAPSATAMDNDTVTIDLTTPVPPNQQPLPAGQTRIYGRVVDAQGAPIRGAAVTIPRGTSPVPERAALTDDDGNYSWILMPGIYTVQINADGFKVAQADGDTQQQPEVELNFALEPQ